MIYRQNQSFFNVRILILSPSLLFFLGCANWALKEKCEKTNWFDYAQGLAFGGQYLEEDGFVKDCKSVDRFSAQQVDLGFKLGREKMCSYDEIQKRGEKGIPVFFKFCDGLDPSQMKTRFAKGLEVFCTQETAYPYGRSGQIYKQVCSPAKEKLFLPLYHKGRSEFLKIRIAELSQQIEVQISIEQPLLSSEAQLSNEYSSLPSPSECKTIRVYNEQLKQDQDKMVCVEASYIQDRRSRLSSDLNRVRASLEQVRDTISDLVSQKTEAKNQLDHLPIEGLSAEATTTKAL